MNKKSETQFDWAKTQAKVIKRAWEDEAFLKELRDDPKAAFEKEAGVTLPENIKFNLRENTLEKLHVVIPLNPEAVNDSELEEAQLEQVSGGMVINVALPHVLTGAAAAFGLGPAAGVAINKLTKK